MSCLSSYVHLMFTSPTYLVIVLHDQIMLQYCVQTEIKLFIIMNQDWPHEYLIRQKFVSLTYSHIFLSNTPPYLIPIDSLLYIHGACHNTHICCSCLYIQDGKTPLDLAREKEKHDVVEYLQQQLGEYTISTHTEKLHDF